jgi:hypothetical protein
LGDRDFEKGKREEEEEGEGEAVCLSVMLGQEETSFP